MIDFGARALLRELFEANIAFPQSKDDLPNQISITTKVLRRTFFLGMLFGIAVSLCCSPLLK